MCNGIFRAFVTVPEALSLPFTLSAGTRDAILPLPKTGRNKANSHWTSGCGEAFLALWVRTYGLSWSWKIGQVAKVYSAR